METKCFEPIVTQQSKVLILGTIPGRASIESGQYYEHQDNLFWDIIFRVCIPHWKCEEIVIADYDTKIKLLISNNIAVWDILQLCNRKGSLDKDINSEIHNDFKFFFERYPNIKTVFFNGQKAEKYFKKHRLETTVNNNRIFIGLPSTSPNNTTNSFYVLREWLQIRKYI